MKTSELILAKNQTVQCLLMKLDIREETARPIFGYKRQQNISVNYLMRNYLIHDE